MRVLTATRGNLPKEGLRDTKEGFRETSASWPVLRSVLQARLIKHMHIVHTAKKCYHTSRGALVLMVALVLRQCMC